MSTELYTVPGSKNKKLDVQLDGISYECPKINSFCFGKGKLMTLFIFK